MGLCEDDCIYREIIEEILSHQGLIYDVCGVSDLEKYEVILSTNKISNFDQEHTIILDRKMLDVFRSAFSGDLKLNEMDAIKSSLMNSELIILKEIKSKFEELKIPFVRKWYWPDFKKVCVLMVHDVDVIDVFPGFADLKELFKYVFYRLILKNYGDNIDEILSLENGENIKSTFFFLYDYKRKIQKHMELGKNHIKLIREVLHSGREICLHGSPEAAVSESRMMFEKRELEKKSGIDVTGYRQHLLNYVFKTPESLISLVNSGFTYDLSLSDNDHFGFMNGVCYPYHPLVGEKRTSIVEIAVAYEDWISYSRKLDYFGQIEVVDMLFKTVYDYNGCLSFCIHNNYVDKRRFSSLYRSFIYMLNSLGDDCWATTTSDCVNWWQKRVNSRIRLTFDNRNLFVDSDCEMPLEILFNGVWTRKMIKNELVRF